VTIDDLGCVADFTTAQVLDNTVIPAIITNAQPSHNCAVGKEDGVGQVTTVDGLAVGATVNYSYQWYDGVVIDPLKLKAGKTNPLLGNNLQGGAASDFTVLVTNKAKGCQGNATINIPDAKVIPAIAISIIQNNTVCDPALAANGSLKAAVSVSGVGVGSPPPANYGITWSTGAVGEVLGGLVAGNYTAHVVDSNTGCQSSDNSQAILDTPTLPVIGIAATDQTSCDVANPNGALAATDAGVANPATDIFTWFNGVGTGGSVHAQTATGVISSLASNDYTVKVRIIATGCEAVQSVLLPDNIVYPTATFTGIGPVSRCDTPNGSLTTTLANLSVLPATNFTLYYINEVGNNFTSNPATIIGSPTNTFNNSNPVYGNLIPGYYTAMVVDNNTTCASTPINAQIIDNTSQNQITLGPVVGAGFCGGVGGQH